MGPPLDETTLIARAKEGDAAAYEELVRIYQRTAYRAAYVIVGSAADAEEVAYDAFVKAFRALSRFRNDAPFKPWLLRIVANEARNRRRSVNRRDALTVRAIREQTNDVTGPSPESVALERERPAGCRRR